MAQYNLESLLAPIGDESPAGDDLEYDAEFLALERAAAPKAERAIGDSVKAAEEPDWDKVAELARAVLGRSKDLRAAVHLTTAWTRTSGMPGWNAGLSLIRGLLEHFWDNVHPQLDAEDDNDPTMRVNSVVPLGDLQGVLGYFRTTPFVQSPRLGRFDLRDLRIANGTLKVTATEGEPQASMTEIEACCMDCAEDELVAVTAAISQSLENAKAIDGIFNDRVGTAGPDFKNLLGEIYELKKFLEPQLARRLPAEGSAEDGEAGEEGSGGGGGVRASNGAIAGPQDVMRRIDELCDYYTRNEPSSPVPLLLRRAQRLVGMDFMDLLKDLAPGGISELRVVSGTPDE
ncbi:MULTISPECIES: type VI secretion system protein TssA [unclassified Rhodanobacter]|uniref:type VI secretion system protein TssA n=1 Tax=unclassified Rhodanobacter TaxID=2621553 RepID=UPI001BDFA215|nr:MULTISPECIES: type VI secretion system protein TssA [unclassified Rhodanobacter]MBT2144545.1 type VI secretion system protein TssA [Rhodanobacter sp. LX-99]MBT2148590.1 type VI secretion system protein TssA [Rhodanobacter sp. LX-100]